MLPFSSSVASTTIDIFSCNIPTSSAFVTTPSVLPEEVAPVIVPVGELQDLPGEESEVAELGRLLEVEIRAALDISLKEVWA
jgi:hypothetical protein